MKITSIQPYAAKGKVLNTHSEKFTSKPANYNAADSVSFTGKGANRAAGLVLSSIVALGAVFGLGTTKAKAYSPAVTLPIPPAPMQTVPFREDSSTPPTLLEFTTEEAEKAIKEAEEMQEAAAKAEENAKNLETEARYAKNAASLSVKTKPVRTAVLDAYKTTTSIEKHAEALDGTVKMTGNYLDEVEEAIENGDITGEMAEEAAALIDEIRNGIANAQVAKNDAIKEASSLDKTSTFASKLARDLIDAAKDGVNLGTLDKALAAGVKTEEATAVADEKLDAMKAAQKSFLADVSKLQKLVATVVSPTPVIAPPVILPTIDTYEMIYGKTPEQVEADRISGQAQMARSTADDLQAEAQKLQEIADAYKIILEAETARTAANGATSNVEKLEAEVEAAKIAADNSLDAVPARIAGREAIEYDLTSVNNEISNLNRINWRAEGVLLTAEKEGVDKEAIDTVLDAVAHAEDVIKDTKAAASLLREAASKARGAKNKEEAEAAIVALDEAKAVAKEAVETAQAEAKELADAINELILTIGATTGRPCGIGPIESTSKLPTGGSFPKACGPWEIYGKTPEQMALIKLESKLEDAKAEAAAALEKFDALEADATRARAFLLMLLAEEN